MWFWREPARTLSAEKVVIRNLPKTQIALHSSMSAQPCSRQRTIHIPRSLQVRMQVMPAGRLFIGMSNAAQHPLT